MSATAETDRGPGAGAQTYAPEQLQAGGPLTAIRKLWAIAWNDIRIEMSDRSALVFLVGLPLLFTWILGIALGGNGGSANSKFPLSVVDEDRTHLSGQLVAVLGASPSVNVETLPRDQAEKLSKDSSRSMLIIPAGFEKGLLAGGDAGLTVRKATGDAGALAIEQAVRTGAGQLGSAVSAARASVAEAERVRPFPDDAARQAYFDSSLAAAQKLLDNPPAEAQVTTSTGVRSSDINAFQQSSAGQLVTWVLLTLMGVAEVLVNERTWGTLRRLVVTPTHKGLILAGKVTGRLVVGLVQITIMIGAGAWLFGVDWGRSPVALVLVVGAFALAAVSLGLMLGTFATSRSQAMWMVIFFSMVMAALGGAWWPLEITPATYQAVVKALPTTWAMLGLTDVIVRGQAVTAVLSNVAVLLAFAALFFSIGVWRFGRERAT